MGTKHSKPPAFALMDPLIFNGRVTIVSPPAYSRVMNETSHVSEETSEETPEVFLTLEEPSSECLEKSTETPTYEVLCS